MPQCPTVIIGAGLAGLSCALRLQEKRIECLLLEASDAPGGRVRTDTVDGFRLDRGFQVLLTAYPRTQHVIDYGALHLKNFIPGALVRFNNRFCRVADPLRQPSTALSTLFAPVSTMADKWRLLRLRDSVCSAPLPEVLGRAEVTTLQRLKQFGFSSRFLDGFFKPFLGGIFLEPDLVTSSRKLDFIFRMFAVGHAALPAFGMQSIPEQMAVRLRPDILRLNSRVRSLDGATVQLATGESITAEGVVIATEHREALRLLGQQSNEPTLSVTCLYYAAAASPVAGPWLVLNGESDGPINNLCVLTDVQSSYAPAGTSLISVTVLDPAYQARADADTERAVRSQLTRWYGDEVSEWRHLRTYRVADALPLQEPPLLSPIEKPVKLSERLFMCGDHTGIACIEGAIASGIRAADAVMR
jgi:protoporphyrinogen oxidase